MAASLLDYTAFTSDELEFMAENELVDILPSFTFTDQVNFIMGTFGPFYPSIPVAVPLWFAVRLKEESLCRIKAPSWLKVDHLQAKIEAERGQPQALTDMPFHYLEIATKLLASASDDVEQAEKVQELIDDLEKCRYGKLSAGLNTVLDVAAREMVPRVLQVDHIGAMEVNNLRYGVFKALDHVVSAGEAQLDRDRREEEAAQRAGRGGEGAFRARIRRQQELRAAAAQEGEAARGEEEEEREDGGAGRGGAAAAEEDAGAGGFGYGDDR